MLAPYHSPLHLARGSPHLSHRCPMGGHRLLGDVYVSERLVLDALLATVAAELGSR